MKFEFIENQNQAWIGAVAKRSPSATKQAELWFENEFLGLKKQSNGVDCISLQSNEVSSPMAKSADFIIPYENYKENVRTGPTFHQAMKPFLILGQCFGLIPVQGITKPLATSLKFTFRDFRMAYTSIVIMMGTFMALVNIYWISHNDIKFDNMSPLIWFGTHTVVFSSFVLIASRWPALMTYWEKIEHTVSYRSVQRQENLKKSINRATIVIFTLALIEHLLSIANGVNSARKCRNTSGILEGYFRQSFPAYYYTFPYTLASGCFWQILNLFFAFAWNFTDSFVITISMGLTNQFQQFNDYLNRYRGQILPADFWDEMRTYYTSLSELMLTVDNKVAIIVLISFVTNLFYVCMQLFNSVTPSDTVIRGIYFWFSMSFLIGRTLAVSFCASRIHDESKKPIVELRLVPADSYSKEAKRLLEQVTNSTIAVSGFNFFYVTRKFILNVAGTVVTYELVLVQLHKGDSVITDPCAR